MIDSPHLESDESAEEPLEADQQAGRTRSVPVLNRALAILELIAESRNGIALPEIARKLQMPKSSAHTILLTLFRQGYIGRSERTRRYVFSSKLLRLANQSLEGLRIREVALPQLRRLSNLTGLSVHMAILEWHEAVLVAKLDPPGAAPLSTWMGRRMELHCTGVGKTLMAYLAPDDLQNLLVTRTFSRHNDNTITTHKRLLQEMETIRANGYAEDDEEDEVGYRCLGVPVYDRGAVAAAISVAGSVTQVTNENRLKLVGALKSTAESIAAAMKEEE